MMLFSYLLFYASSITLLISMVGYMFNKKKMFFMSNSAPFECGVNSALIYSSPFSLRFFILAVVFLIFDVELILLFPLVLNNIQFFSLLKMNLFFMILFLISWGLMWEWNQGILTWSK